MDIFWDETALDDYLYWQDNNRKVLRKENSLIKVCQRTPLEGSGKPNHSGKISQDSGAVELSGNIGWFIKRRMVFFILRNAGIIID